MDIASTVCDMGTQVPLIAMKSAWKEHGVVLPYSILREGMGSKKLDHISITRNAIYTNFPHFTNKIYKIPDEHILETMEDYTVRTLQQETHHSILFDDLPDLFKKLRTKGYKLGHTTGYTRKMTEPILNHWKRYHNYVPDAVVCSDEVPRGRPCPDSIKACSEILGIKLADCINIDDSDVGNQAGVNAGIKSIGVYEYGNWLGPLLLNSPIINIKAHEHYKIEYITKLNRITPHVYPTTSYFLKFMLHKDS